MSSIDGAPSFTDINQCQQCDRQFVNLPGNGGCVAGTYCNEAALCAPCNVDVFCGPACLPCGGAVPFCVSPDGSGIYAYRHRETADFEFGDIVFVALAPGRE